MDVGLGCEERAIFMIQEAKKPLEKVISDFGLANNTEFLGFEVQRISRDTACWNEPNTDNFHKTFKGAFIEWLNIDEQEHEIVEISYIFKEPGSTELTPVWLKSH